MQPASKASKLRAAMADGRWQDAIRLAAKFPQLGDEKVAIQRAHQAFVRPDFCQQTGRDPAKLIEEGKAALKRRYGARKST